MSGSIAVTTSFGFTLGESVPSFRLTNQGAGYSPVRVPEGARPSIAETIARANYGLRLGKFEMDYDDGELRFQLAHVLPGGLLDEEIISRSFSQAMTMLDRYLPAVLSVIYGNEHPKDAIRNVEQPEESGDE